MTSLFTCIEENRDENVIDATVSVLNLTKKNLMENTGRVEVAKTHTGHGATASSWDSSHKPEEAVV